MVSTDKAITGSGLIRPVHGRNERALRLRGARWDLKPNLLMSYFFGVFGTVTCSGRSNFGDTMGAESLKYAE